jgi:hypothetical protein
MEYPVIISYCNSGYYGFAQNMLISLNNTVQYHKVHFYCLDEEIYEKLSKLEFKNINLKLELFGNLNTSKNFETYGSNNYNSITHTKVNILRAALELYPFIHFIDCDVVCMKEPLLEHYAKYAEYDIVFQHDAGMHSADKLHAPTLHHIWACTGNTSFRNTPGTHFILDKIEEYQNKYSNKNDQECLYQYFLDLPITDIRDLHNAKLFTYEVEEYTNGFWLNNDIGGLDKTYFFHANHVDNHYNKVQLLKKANQLFV